jgi:hypothetical protein
MIVSASTQPVGSARREGKKAGHNPLDKPEQVDCFLIMCDLAERSEHERSGAEIGVENWTGRSLAGEHVCTGVPGYARVCSSIRAQTRRH